MKEKKNFLILNILAPLLIGGLIYYFISPDVIFVKQMDTWIGGGIHLTVMTKRFWLTAFLRNYLLDMLWGYALVYVLFFVFDDKTAGLSKSFLLAAGFSALMEVLQLMAIVPGTFDSYDILAEILVELLAVFIIKATIQEEEKYEEKS